MKIYNKLMLFQSLSVVSIIVTSLTIQKLFYNHPNNASHVIAISLIAVISIIPMMIFVRQFIKKLIYLEHFIKMCSWCNKVKIGDKWLTLEEYTAQHLCSKTSHGICFSCAEEFKKESANVEEFYDKLKNGSK